MFCPPGECVSILGSCFHPWPVAYSPAGPRMWPPLLLSHLFIWVLFTSSRPVSAYLRQFPSVPGCVSAAWPRAPRLLLAGRHPMAADGHVLCQLGVDLRGGPQCRPGDLGPVIGYFAQ